MTPTITADETQETTVPAAVEYRSRSELAECTCPDACERDHELD